jgi:hypothetical protein
LRGVVPHSRGREALEALDDQVGALLATSAVGHELSAEHPYGNSSPDASSLVITGQADLKV